MMQRFLGTSIALIMLAVPAATTAGQSSTQKISGHLVDVTCAGDHAAEPGYIEKHDKACNLSCGKSGGFSLVTADRKVLKFDQKGNEQALALIKATDKVRDWKVVVTGTPSGESIAVSSIAMAP
jgi:hypothetical protein